MLPLMWVGLHLAQAEGGHLPTRSVLRRKRHPTDVAQAQVALPVSRMPEADVHRDGVAVPARARLTTRLRNAAGTAVATAKRVVCEVAASLGVSWPVAQAAFTAQAAALPAQPAPVEVLGIDETRRGKPKYEVNPLTGKSEETVGRWHTGFVDVTGGQGLLGQVEGRTAEDAVVAQADQVRGHRYVGLLPGRRTQGPASGDDRGRSLSCGAAGQQGAVRGAAAPDLPAPRSPRPQDRPGVDLPQSPHPQLGRSHRRAGHEDVDQAGGGRACGHGHPHCLDRQGGVAWCPGLQSGAVRSWPGTHASLPLYTWCADSGIAELKRLAATIETWWKGIAAFLQTGITNAKSEGINRAVKLAARNAYGFRNPENQRLRKRSITSKVTVRG